jgi:hypothetical protein
MMLVEQSGVVSSHLAADQQHKKRRMLTSTEREGLSYGNAYQKES